MTDLRCDLAPKKCALCMATRSCWWLFLPPCPLSSSRKIFLRSSTPDFEMGKQRYTRGVNTNKTTHSTNKQGKQTPLPKCDTRLPAPLTLSLSWLFQASPNICATRTPSARSSRCGRYVDATCSRFFFGEGAWGRQGKHDEIGGRVVVVVLGATQKRERERASCVCW